MTRRGLPIRVRPELLELPAYRQGKPAPEGAFKLSSNENPYPPLPSVLEALAEAQDIHRYPDAAKFRLRGLLAKQFGVSEPEVLIGAGSVALLTQLLQITARDGEVIYSWRSFEAYPIITLISGGTSIQVPNTAHHDHDLDAMLAQISERTRAIILCTPNNPTGSTIERSAFESFMAQVPEDVLVILDEAYSEFNRDPEAVDGANYLGRWSNLVVLRTFSKAYGLAGLRIGYAIGHPDILALAAMAAVPLSLIQHAVTAAEASLESEAAAELSARVDKLVQTREQFFAGLAERDPKGLLDIPVSQANFVWLPAQQRNADEVEELFRQNNLIVRNLVDGVRITIAEPESVPILLRIIEELVAKLSTRR